MRSLWNPNRFLRSISPTHWGNPQPTRAFKNRMERFADMIPSSKRSGRILEASGSIRFARYHVREFMPPDDVKATS